jgi:hypothetical protein
MTVTGRIADLILTYADGPRMLEEVLAGIPEDELHFRPGPERWSIHENVIHIADAEIVGAMRLRFLLAQPGATLVGYDQERWGRAFDYSRQSRDEALALFAALRSTTTRLLKAAPASAWEHVGTHTERGPLALVPLLQIYADHVPYHLRTIAKRRRQYAEGHGQAGARSRSSG